jgi:hypothetical protein
VSEDEGANGAMLRAFGQSLRKSRTPREGEASGVPQREKCSQQSAGALLLEKRGRRVGSCAETKERTELC